MAVQTRDLVLGLLSKAALSGGLQGTAGRIGLSAAYLGGVRPQSPQGGLISDSAKLAEELAELPTAIKELTAALVANTAAQGAKGGGGATSAMSRLAGRGFNQDGLKDSLGAPSKDPGVTKALAGGGEEEELAGGAEAGPIGAIAIIGLELAKLPGELAAWGDSLIQSQRTVAQFSGQMATAYAQLDVGRLRRNIEQAQATAGTASYQAQAQNRLEQQMQPWNNLVQNFENWLAGVLEDATASVLGGINKLIPGFQGDKKSDATTVASAIIGLAGRAIDEGKNRAEARERRLHPPQQPANPFWGNNK